MYVMIMPAYTLSVGLKSDVTMNFIDGGVIFARFSGEVKKSQALSSVVGRKVSNRSG